MVFISRKIIKKTPTLFGNNSNLLFTDSNQIARTSLGFVRTLFHQAHLNNNYINVTQIELYIMYVYRLLHSIVNIFSTEEFDHFYAMILEKHNCLIAINLNYNHEN